MGLIHLTGQPTRVLTAAPHLIVHCSQSRKQNYIFSQQSKVHVYAGCMGLADTWVKEEEAQKLLYL